jgi:hypothetical protein
MLGRFIASLKLDLASLILPEIEALCFPRIKSFLADYLLILIIKTQCSLIARGYKEYEVASCFSALLVNLFKFMLLLTHYITAKHSGRRLGTRVGTSVTEVVWVFFDKRELVGVSFGREESFLLI